MRWTFFLAALLCLPQPSYAQDAEPVKAGDFRVVAVDRPFNVRLGTSTGIITFQRDGTLLYRPRGAVDRADADGSWAFTGNTLCLRITTLNDGVPLCGTLAALGAEDFEMDGGVHLFR